MTKSIFMWNFILGIGISFLFYYSAYLQSFKVDYFLWGTNNDGLFLLVIPLIILPILVLLSIMKWFLIKRSNISAIIKNGHWVYIALGIFIVLFTIIEIYFLAMTFSTLAGLTGTLEQFYLVINKDEFGN